MGSGFDGLTNNKTGVRQESQLSIKLAALVLNTYTQAPLCTHARAHTLYFTYKNDAWHTCCFDFEVNPFAWCDWIFTATRVTSVSNVYFMHVASNLSKHWIHAYSYSVSIHYNSKWILLFTIFIPWYESIIWFTHIYIMICTVLVGKVCCCNTVGRLL